VFSLNTTTGVMYLGKTPIVATFSLSMKAVDGGSPAKSSVETYTMTITDGKFVIHL